MRATLAHSKTKSLLAERAQRMRHQPTRSEEMLWRAVRAKQLGVAVRRQVVLGQRIADFFVPAAKLVIEVDGEYHERHKRADERRDRELARLGYRVLHVSAEEVVCELPQVLERIRGVLRAEVR